jgi:hypothetical protein
LPKLARNKLGRSLHGLAAPAALLIAACTPTQVLTGTARAPIAAADVVVYTAAPARFEQIALLYATEKSWFHTGGQPAVEELVRRLARQAAKLGANGIILDEVADEQSLSLGTGVGSQSYTHNADISLGIGGLFEVYKKIGNARAIYVPRE